MNGSVVRTVGASARVWRMRQWPHDPTVAHLIFLDHQAVPTPEQIEHAVDHARARGARAIRTSALFPDSAAVARASGFIAIDQLALLRIALDEPTVAALPPTTHRLRSLRAWSMARAADVDQAAFGPLWGNDTASLRDIGRATPQHLARAASDGRQLVGFAMSGSAAGNGYVQRVAVSPAHRRQGIGRDLVVDALNWMHRGGRASALVNTGLDNAAALTLYEQLGFCRLADTLTIAERRLSG